MKISKLNKHYSFKSTECNWTYIFVGIRHEICHLYRRRKIDDEIQTIVITYNWKRVNMKNWGKNEKILNKR